MDAAGVDRRAAGALTSRRSSLAVGGTNKCVTEDISGRLLCPAIELHVFIRIGTLDDSASKKRKGAGKAWG